MRRYLSSRCDASTDRLRPTSYPIAIQNIGRLKSFVDDLDMEWGIVRMRVGLSYDLLRFSLLFRDLSGFRFSAIRPKFKSAPPSPPRHARAHAAHAPPSGSARKPPRNARPRARTLSLFLPHQHTRLPRPALASRQAERGAARGLGGVKETASAPSARSLFFGPVGRSSTSDPYLHGFLPSTRPLLLHHLRPGQLHPKVVARASTS